MKKPTDEWTLKAVIITFLFAFGVLFTHLVAIPTIEGYPKLANVLNRSSYFEVLFLIVFETMLIMGYFQVNRRVLFKTYIFFFYFLYSFVMVVMLFGKVENHHQLTLNPFNVFVLKKQVLFDVLLNFICFIPFGLLLGYFLELKKVVVTSISIILSIEIIQYIFFIGAFQTSDIILNFAGVLFGNFLCERYKMKFTFY